MSQRSGGEQPPPASPAVRSEKHTSVRRLGVPRAGGGALSSGSTNHALGQGACRQEDPGRDGPHSTSGLWNPSIDRALTKTPAQRRVRGVEGTQDCISALNRGN